MMNETRLRKAEAEVGRMAKPPGGMTPGEFRRKWGADVWYQCCIAPLCPEPSKVAPDALADFARLPGGITIQPFDYAG